jgi:hypothetical protein
MTSLPTRVIITRHSTISDGVLSPQTLPSICFTSKQVRSEAILAYLRRTRFIFEQGCVRQLFAFDSFVSQFERGFEAIRMLSFYDVIWFGESDFPGEFYPERLVSKCAGLRSLVLETRVRYLLRIPWIQSRGVVKLYTKEEIEERWGLEALFEMGRLEYVRFRCRMSRSEFEVLALQRPEEMVKNVGTVLKRREDGSRLLSRLCSKEGNELVYLSWSLRRSRGQ